MSEQAYKKHLHILSKDEIEQLYALPLFNPDERQLYFALDEQERLAMEGMRGLPSKVFFVLQLGYFKAKALFFVFELDQVKEDISYILKTYFPKSNIQTLSMPARSTRLIQRKLIRQMTGFRDCKGTAKKALLRKALQLAGIHSDPVFIFRSLLHYLEVHKIILPAYSSIQRDIISQSIQLEQARLESLLTKLLSTENKNLLDQLLEPHPVGKVSFYLLTYLQQEPSDFQYQQMKRQLERKRWIASLYQLATDILPKLSISNENIKYYGSLAQHYSIYKLSRIQGEIRYLYLLCYGFNRYHHLSDTLIEAIRYHLRDYETEGDQTVDIQIINHKLKAHEYLSQVPTVLRLFIDPSIENAAPFSWVRDKAFQFLNAEKLEFVAGFIEKEKLDKRQIRWAFFSSLGRRMGLNLRPLITHLTFKSNTPNDELIEAIGFAKELFEKGKRLNQIQENKLPTAFIPKSISPYLLKEKEKLCLSRYEFLLYQKLRNKIESGDIFVPESYGYKSFDQDLINGSYWDKNQDHIIGRLDLPKLKRPIEDLLANWRQQIETKYKALNYKLEKGKLTNIEITGRHKDGSLKWHLHVPSAGKTINHDLYQQFPSIGIIPLLHLVEEKTHFLQAFEHILKKNTFIKADKDKIMACILAYGTNYGIGKIASISDLSYPELATTAHNYLRLETLQEANKKIIDQTMKLPMFEYYKVQDRIHSSSDGQKYGTLFHTINSRYSPKYFGLSKGIAAYTLVANNLPINARMIGANEHESHYVFDLLYNNISSLDPDIHSTDQHGINKVNFAILDMFGYSFAPRYANINSKSKLVHCFQHPTKYMDFAIKPLRKIDQELIKSEWNNVKRIFASLALKSTTQSNIIRKLSAYPRTNRTRSALIEYDAIVKTDFVLRYLDSPPLQHSIENVLSRGENINRLRKHIFHAHGGKFRVHSVGEQQVWSECTRLIVNAMIYYNTLLLSELLKKKQKQKDLQSIEKIKKISPIAWQHIHLHGRYQFLIDKVNINIPLLIQKVDF